MHYLLDPGTHNINIILFKSNRRKDITMLTMKKWEKPSIIIVKKEVLEQTIKTNAASCIRKYIIR